MPDLGGAWLNATYFAALRKTHSPRQAHGCWGANGITEILIDPATRAGDSMAVALGVNNREGMPLRYVHIRTGSNLRLTTYAREEANDGLLATNLRYQTLNADTLLFLDQRNPKTTRVVTTVFKRLQGVSGAGAALRSPPFQVALSQFVNSLDFRGTHLMTDSAGHECTVRFASDGTLQGFQRYRKYQVNTDFEGPFHEFDTVFFDIYQKTQHELAFAINGDTIRLYTVHDDTATYKRQRGHLCYTLIRKSGK